MLPPVGVLIPILLLFRDYKLMDTHIGLVLVMMLINLPIMIWMLFTYFREIPADILEASRMDATERNFGMERIILDFAVNNNKRCTIDNVYYQLFKPRRLVLRKTQRGVCDGYRPNSDYGLVQSKTVGSRVNIWGSKIMGRYS